ncbi:MAG: FliH/SctL family protein, partial [Planctomycetota bacterium]|nr:FliH/SctL family protein [Planctomycetota bacterium]
MAEVLKKAMASLSSVADFNLSDLEEEGNRQLEACRTQIEQMLLAAETDAQKSKDHAREEGYLAGIKQAEDHIRQEIHEKAEEKSQAELDRLNESVRELYRAYEAWIQEYTVSVTDLATMIAERILRSKLESSPQIVLEWIREALVSTRMSNEVKLLLNPTTANEIQEALIKMLQQEDLLEKVEV